MDRAASELLDLLRRVETEVEAQCGVFDDPSAYRAGVRDVCTRLADELTALDRGPFQGGSSTPASVALDALLRRAVAELRHTMGSRPLELQLRRTPILAAVDEASMQWVLETLILEAAHRAPSDTPIVVVADLEDGAAVIAVEDGGPPRPFGPVPGGPQDPLREVRGLVAAHDGDIMDERDADPPVNRTVLRLPAAEDAGGLPPRVLTVPELQQER